MSQKLQSRIALMFRRKPWFHLVMILELHSNQTLTTLHQRITLITVKLEWMRLCNRNLKMTLETLKRHQHLHLRRGIHRSSITCLEGNDESVHSSSQVDSAHGIKFGEHASMTDVRNETWNTTSCVNCCMEPTYGCASRHYVQFLNGASCAIGNASVSLTQQHVSTECM